MYIDVAEIVLHKCTKMDPYHFHKPDFALECSYDFVKNENDSIKNREGYALCTIDSILVL